MARPADADDARWFAKEVQPNESSLRTYLKGAFPTVRDGDDVVQESYIRIRKAHTLRPIKSARDYLFGIARRLAVDAIRRDRSAGHESVTEQHALRLLKDEPAPAEAISRRQELLLLTEAIDALPAHCRAILILRKLDGLSHREIAERLGISPESVQVQVGRGMDKCARFLRSRGVNARRKAPGEHRNRLQPARPPPSPGPGRGPFLGAKGPVPALCRARRSGHRAGCRHRIQCADCRR